MITQQQYMQALAIIKQWERQQFQRWLATTEKDLLSKQSRRLVITTSKKGKQK